MSLSMEWLLNGLWKLLFREAKNMSAIAEIEELTPEYVKEVGKEWVDHWVKTLPAEELLKYLGAKERLEGLETIDIIDALSPEALKKLKEQLNNI